ncbi:MAG: immunoglobulin domain-containing protein [Verrucomicrobiales bacterium]|nr:immunoglobulin domain-containing protein [Verrucomicrobiales bacterium]
MRFFSSLLLLASAPLALAAPIPGLFNTGVDNDANILPPNTLDPHYTIIESPDPTFPGPDIFTSSSIPSPPWLIEGPGSANPDSRWITPNTVGGNVAGSTDNFTVRTTFDLTGFDQTTANITGRWSTDNGGVDIIINGFSTGQSNDGNFGVWHDFFLDFPSDFVAGVNTIDFVFNNAGDAPNPGGLRIEMIGTIAAPGSPPSFLVQPKSVPTALEGDTVTLTSNVDGDPPLTFQWKKGDAELPGETATNLVLDNVTIDNSGDYTLVATNPNGSTTSNIATVTIAKPIPGLFNTGVDDSGTVLFDFDLDSHYSIFVNPDSEFSEPIVHDTLIWPIVEGPWVAANTESAWIAPRGDTSGAAGGNYTYRLTFDLTDVDPSTAFITGQSASDNAGSISLNGTATGATTGGLNALAPFTISASAGAPFIQGTNTLDFLVNNAGSGPTALRVEGINGGANPGSGPGGAPNILRQPVSQIGFPNESLTLDVLADGNQPLTYQWRKNGEDIPGEIGATLFLFTGAPGVEGNYDVVVSNNLGNDTSDPATIDLLDLVPGVFPTGVDNAGELLFDFDIDPHYTLIENANDPLLTDAVVVTANGAWVFAPLDNSLWIGAVGDTLALPGNYTYRTTVNLDGFDPATALLDARFATDDGLVGISINEAPFAVTGGSGFGSFSNAQIPAGSFTPGLNTIDFTVVNGGAAPATNPHGLHVNRLRIGAVRLPAIDLPNLNIDRLSPTEVKISWPTSATGWSLTTSNDAKTWTTVPDAPSTEGENQTVTLTIAQTTLFRLELATP